MANDAPATTGTLAPGGVEDRLAASERLRIVVLAIMVAALVVVPVGWWMDNGQALWTALAGGIAAGVAYVLDRRGRGDLAVLFLLVAMLVAVTANLVVGEGIHDSGMILYPTIVVVGSMLLQPRHYAALVLLVLASVGVICWLGWKGLIAPRFQDLTDIADFVAVGTILVVQAIAVEVMALGLFRSLGEARREAAERRAAEDEVRRLNAELEKRVATRTAELAAANEELEAFSWSVSHDLRAPLRVANNYAAILNQDFAGEWDPAARQMLERILASNSRMNLLIDELLRFSRLGRKEVVKREVDMAIVAQAVIGWLSAASPERRVEWVVGDLPKAWADPVLIEQVYANLIGNAFKYTGQRELAHIEVGYDAEDGKPSWFVRDDGVGFNMIHADKLFGVFERLHHDDEFEGSGIGLATAHRIVQKHGGTIWADSEPGEGATFRFTLPGPGR